MQVRPAEIPMQTIAAPPQPSAAPYPYVYPVQYYPPQFSPPGYPQYYIPVPQQMPPPTPAQELRAQEIDL